VIGTRWQASPAHDACGTVQVPRKIAEYRAEVDIRDYVWTRKAVLPHAPAAKVADFAAKRRQSEAVKPTGQSPA
jgi:hypothetical protein